jgi:hypothetical protein
MKFTLTFEEYSNLLQLHHFINLQLKNDTLKLDNEFSQIRLGEIAGKIQGDLDELALKNKQNK